MQEVILALRYTVFFFSFNSVDISEEHVIMVNLMKQSLKIHYAMSPLCIEIDPIMSSVLYKMQLCRQQLNF